MIRIGVICPSEIAFRRFLPSLQMCTDFKFAGIAIASAAEWGMSTADFAPIRRNELQKAQTFITSFGGKIFEGYANLCSSKEVDAIYLPLPPALHYKWTKFAIENGKHAFVEKPSTTCIADTQALVNLAKSKGLALHENYMFAYHKQLKFIQQFIASGEIGDVRLYRICFGFPLRQRNDFRYNAMLGGGALLDCGGYVLKYADMILGATTKVDYARLNNINGFEVDMYGSAALSNDEGITVQIAFGMDLNYKCELEVWGSKGTFYTNRVLTAPDGFVPEAIIYKGNEVTKIQLPKDNAFRKSIRVFADCINNADTRNAEYEVLLRQASLIEEFKSKI